MSSLDDLIARAKLPFIRGPQPRPDCRRALTLDGNSNLAPDPGKWRGGSAKGRPYRLDGGKQPAPLLDGIALMLMNRYYGGQKDPVLASANVIVGIALSGIPLATVISVQEAAQPAIYHPSKQNTSDHPVGSISGNFAPVAKERCIIVDDVITSGNTMREVVRSLKKHGAVTGCNLGHFR